VIYTEKENDKYTEFKSMIRTSFLKKENDRTFLLFDPLLILNFLLWFRLFRFQIIRKTCNM